MNPATAREINKLRNLTVAGLRARYAEVFGEETRSHNKAYLYRRIAWRLQAIAEGDLSERARQRALEIASDADLRVAPPRCQEVHFGPPVRGSNARDERLPNPGTLLTREYRGQVFVVKVLDDGFEFEGNRFKSLSAIARSITATRWNGYAFFGLLRNGKEAQCA